MQHVPLGEFITLHCSKDCSEKPRLLLHFVKTQDLQTSTLLITPLHPASSKLDWPTGIGSKIYLSLKNKRNEKWSQCSIFTQNLDTINPLGIGISILVMKAFGCYREKGWEMKYSIFQILPKTTPQNCNLFFFFKGKLLKMQLNAFFIDKSHVKILTPYTKAPKMKLKLQSLHCNHYRHSRCSLCCPRNICYFLLGKNMLFVTSLYPEAVKVFHSFLTLMWQILRPFLVPTKSCPMLISLIVWTFPDPPALNVVCWCSAQQNTEQTFSIFTQKIHSLLQGGKPQTLSEGKSASNQEWL